MKLRALLISVLGFLAATAMVQAASEFPWLSDLRIRAEADPTGFRAQLAARFRIGDAEVQTIIDQSGGPADAYVVLRYGEISGRPTALVIERYQATRGQGWGALAQSLGIKPGSAEFKALKAGHDLPPAGKAGDSGPRGKKSREASDHGPGKGKGHEKDDR